jgi:hypothetical protein
VGSEALIRVAVTRDAYPAIPAAGRIAGGAGDCLGMGVEVAAVDRQGAAPAAPRQAALA